MVLTGGVNRQVLRSAALGGAGGAGDLGRAGCGEQHWGRGGGCGTGGRWSGRFLAVVGQEAAELGATGQVRDPLLLVHHRTDKIGTRRMFL